MIITSFNDAFFKTYITFEAASAIQELTRPLSIFHINFFSYNVYYKDGSHFKFSNNPAYTQAYYQQELFKISGYAKLKTENSIILNHWVNTKKMIDFDKQCGQFYASFAIIEDHEQYSEHFHFGVPENERIESLYPHLDFLHRFIAYFREKANPFILEARKNRILLPIQKNIILKNSVFTESAGINQLRLNLGSTFNDVYLTSREIQIILLLAKGMTQPKISNYHGVSIKTLETQIAQIKAKLHAKTSFELGFKIGKIRQSLFGQKVENLLEESFSR